ncbi:hypothetical protein OFO01_05445 [Campylobacter sp. JMF_01 NE2]|uniref:hypothetical protein n=1 Tax=unclassified Campylobacter TaxID=2593542 RepID=UPI0022E9FD41|nr:MULTISPECIES: hypothetical protein [unclassified Campylobacter]MDA3052898.1 hypothetical protein [Campylobacter sp. JMF_03 NE3]MDA3067229.1 hypothetical protein [Campylobacter sp. JMF_01 NE2]
MKKVIFILFVLIVLFFIFFNGRIDNEQSVLLGCAINTPDTKNGGSCAKTLKKDYGFYEKLNSNKIDEILLGDNKDELLIIGYNQHIELLKFIKCNFLKNNNHLCHEFWHKSNGKIKLIQYDDFEKLSKRNLKIIVIERKK